MMLRVVFERMLSSGYVHTSFLQFIDEFETLSHGLRNGVWLIFRENSFEGVVSKSYEQSFAAYHGWATRTAVFASLPHLPTRSKLMKKLKENGNISMYICKSMIISVYWSMLYAAFQRRPWLFEMQSFIDSSAIVVQYIPDLFHSREMAKELLEQISSLALISASKPTP